jgi:hypothetical protein
MYICFYIRAPPPKKSLYQSNDMWMIQPMLNMKRIIVNFWTGCRRTNLLRMIDYCRTGGCRMIDLYRTGCRWIIDNLRTGRDRMIDYCRTGGRRMIYSCRKRSARGCRSPTSAVVNFAACKSSHPARPIKVIIKLAENSRQSVPSPGKCTQHQLEGEGGGDFRKCNLEFSGKRSVCGRFPFACKQWF